MKRNLVLLAFLLFTPIHAFGDYVPGRVRASAAASMSITKATGLYQNVGSAKLVQLKTDGQGYTGFSLQLNQAPLIPFTVKKNSRSRCGQIFVATYSDNGRHSELRVEETSVLACLRSQKPIWRAQLTTSEENKPASQLFFAGTPEFFILTQ